MRAVFSASEFFQALESCRREALQVVGTRLDQLPKPIKHKFIRMSFRRPLAILLCSLKNSSVHQDMLSSKCLQTNKAMQFICLNETALYNAGIRRWAISPTYSRERLYVMIVLLLRFWRKRQLLGYQQTAEKRWVRRQWLVQKQ